MNKFILGLSLLGLLSFSGSVLTHEEKDIKKLISGESCENCDLKGVDLSGANLSGANLSGANLSGANLEGASLKTDDEKLAEGLKTASKFLIPGAGMVSGLSSLMGSGGSSTANDLPAAQLNLEQALRNALADLSEAESYFAQARGDAEAAAASLSQAERLRGKDDVDIKEAMDETASSREKSAEFEANATELSAEAKALYAKGLLPYAKGVANTAVATKQAKTWLNAAQKELKSVRNPMKLGKLKKSLGGGLSLAKSLPKFFKTLGSSTKGVFAFAKSQKMDTKDAQSSLPDEF